MAPTTRHKYRMNCNEHNLAKNVLEECVVNDLILSKLYESGNHKEIIFLKSILKNKETYGPYLERINKRKLVIKTKQLLSSYDPNGSIGERIKLNNSIFQNFVDDVDSFALLCRTHHHLSHVIDCKLVEYLDLPYYKKKAMFYINKLSKYYKIYSIQYQLECY